MHGGKLYFELMLWDSKEDPLDQTGSAFKAWTPEMVLS